MVDVEKVLDEHQKHCLTAACGLNNTPRDCARCAIKFGVAAALLDMKNKIKETFAKARKECDSDG